MPYTNDAQTLADVVSPAYAALQAGINQGQTQQAQDVTNTIDADPGHMAAQIAQPGLANMYTQAQTANSQAIGQQNQTQANNAAALAPSTVAAGQAENTSKMTASQAQSMGSIGQIAGQVASMMDNVPPPARPAAMQQVASQYGINLSQLGPLANGDPDQLRAFSQNAVKMSAAYTTQTGVEGQRAASAQGVANTEGTSRIIAAQTGADARVQAATLQQKAREMNQNTDQFIAQTIRTITNLKTNGQPVPPELLSALQTATQYKSALAVAIGPQLVSGQDVNTPQQRAAEAVNNLVGQPTPSNGSAPPPPAPPGGQPAGNQLAASATQAFGSYDPDKYDYGINPATGKFAKKPK